MLERQSETRQLPVRLCDIRPAVRFDAARRVAVREPGWAHAVFKAALDPSPTVYYVSGDALPTLLRVAA